jgi:hypothetical protein
MLTQLLLAARVWMGQFHSPLITERLESAWRWFSGIKDSSPWRRQKSANRRNYI